MVRRGFDILFSLTLLTVLSPLMLAAAALIRLTSPGPVFFLSRRAGRDNRPFYMLKFRTMKVGADKGSSITAGDDPRVTPLGRFLRMSKIDELPQFLNVLRGDMAIVGPRPEAWSIVQTYYNSEDMKLLKVKPGITCTGQLYGYLYQTDVPPPQGMDPERFYAEQQLPAKLARDAHYLAHHSAMYDLSLIMKTVIAIVLKIFNMPFPWPLPPKEGYPMQPRTKHADRPDSNDMPGSAGIC